MCLLVTPPPTHTQLGVPLQGKWGTNPTCFRSIDGSTLCSLIRAVKSRPLSKVSVFCRLGRRKRSFAKSKRLLLPLKPDRKSRLRQGSRTEVLRREASGLSFAMRAVEDEVAPPFSLSLIPLICKSVHMTSNSCSCGNGIVTVLVMVVFF